MTNLAYAALWLFVFSIPWERIIVLPGVSIVTRATGGLALLLVLFTVVTTGRFRRWHAFHVAALIFWVWAGCGLLLFGGGAKIPAKFWTFAQLILVLWMVWELGSSHRRLLGLFTAYVFGAYVAALDTLLLFRREAGVLHRFAAGGADPNDFAMVLALGVPMAWYIQLITRSTLLRWACWGYLPAAIVAIGLSGSRGGMLATTVALLVVPFSMKTLSPSRLATAVLMLGLGGALAVAYTPRTLIERLSTTGTEVSGGHFGGRGKLWIAGLKAFVERPVFGYGTSTYKDAIRPILGNAAQVAHNSFLSVMVEEGIVGLLLFLWMMVAAFRSLRRLPFAERRFALVLFATMCVAMLPLTWEDQKAVWFILAALVALSHVPLTEASPERPPAAWRVAPARRRSPGRVVGEGRVPGRSRTGDVTA